MHDLTEIHLALLIQLAIDGDGEPLAKHMRENGFGHMWADAPALRDFLINVITGKIRLKRPRKNAVRRDHWWREQSVHREVTADMGRKRNKDDRETATKKWCDYYGTDSDRYNAFLKHGRTASKNKRRTSA
jgi:hypothetical protein